MKMIYALFILSFSVHSYAIDMNGLAAKVAQANRQVHDLGYHVRQDSCYFSGYIAGAIETMEATLDQTNPKNRAVKKILKASDKIDFQNSRCYNGTNFFQAITTWDGSRKINRKIRNADRKVQQAISDLNNERELEFDTKTLKPRLLQLVQSLPIYHSSDVGLINGRTWKPNVCYTIGQINFLAEMALRAEGRNVYLENMLDNSLHELKHEICLALRWTDKYRQERQELIHNMIIYTSR